MDKRLNLGQIGEKTSKIVQCKGIIPITANIWNYELFCYIGDYFKENRRNILFGCR